MAEDDHVEDGERLWRRIHPTFVKTVVDGPPRISTAVFKSSDGELSVDRAAIVERIGRDFRFTIGVDPYKGCAVAELITSDVRALELTVEPDPVDGNPAHAEIRGRFDNPAAKRLHSIIREVHWATSEV